jgi:hypothetical protein
VVSNGGDTAQSLTGFYIQSDPGQSYHLASFVGSIAARQTLVFQSGAAATSNPGAGIYKLTGAYIYRNADTSDYALLARPTGSNTQVDPAVRGEIRLASTA